MAHIEPGVPCPGNPEYTVQISLIIDTQAACLMHRIHKLTDTVIIDPGILRIGDHQRRRMLRHRRFQSLQIGKPVFIRIQCDQLISQCSRCAGIGRMRKDRRYNLVSLLPLAVRLMISPDRLHIGKIAWEPPEG